MILTGNQSFGSWGGVFGDRIIASAILDRVLHYPIMVNSRGDSFRLRRSSRPACSNRRRSWRDPTD